jgi:hypothetical protein
MDDLNLASAILLLLCVPAECRLEIDTNIGGYHLGPLPLYTPLRER